jgi:hypothetical protein
VTDVTTNAVREARAERIRRDAIEECAALVEAYGADWHHVARSVTWALAERIRALAAPAVVGRGTPEEERRREATR